MKRTTWEDWESLVMRPRTPRHMIMEAVREEGWYELRKTMKGTTMDERYDILMKWLEEHRFDERSRIQVSNYVNALKRAGMLVGLPRDVE